MRLEVGEERAGERLDAFLAPEFASRAAAAKLIDAGAVTVDGSARPRSWRVSAGELVEVTLPAEPAADPAAVPFDVVYEDEDLMVVDKPAGVVVHPAPGHSGPTLAEALRGRAAGGEDPSRAGIVHRLDRDTSGLMIVAKSEEAHAELQRMIREHEVRREYLALVSGHPDAESGTIDAPIGRDRNDVGRMAVGGRAERPAVTHFELAEPLAGASLLHLKLETGRTHQIRVHLAAIGHPVLGDPLYGVPGGQIGLRRQFLHAARLAFTHPADGRRVELTSDLPADLAEALERARDAG
jgi:23S rRNA pseudouridine1911/1915/1917 synthase